MTETRVPSIPAITASNLADVARAVKQIVDVREGLTGDPLDANVTYRDLVNAGAVTLRPGWNNRLPVQPVMPPWVDPDGYDPTTDLTQPPAPENVTATGLFALVQLQWDRPTYRNHSYAEIWRADTNAIGNALLIGTTDTSFYADNLGTSATRYYWVRFVSQANVKGPYHATNGLEASTALNPALLIESLQGQIRESELYSTLGARINLIDAPDTTPGSVNYRLAQEASARAAQIQSEATARAAAITAESQARSAAILNEANTRAQSILDEALARANGDSALQTQINTLSAASTGDLQDLIAALEEEQTARIAGDAAEATSRQTLAAQIRGSYTGTDPSLLSTGLLYNERQARVSAEGVIASNVSALQATVTNNYNTLNSAITSEQTARVNADTAITNSFNSLSATVGTKTRTFFQPSAPTATASGDVWFDSDDNNKPYRWSGSAWVGIEDPRISSTAALLTSEQTARANADSALTSSINQLSATVTNNYNVLNAAITSEQSARADADSALSTSLSSLTATVGTKARTWYQSTAPTTGLTVGDIWFDTANNRQAKRWNGTSWDATDDARISANSAAITAEQTARANADSALTTSINSLTSTVNTNYNTLNSAITSEATTRSNADTTLTNSLNTLSSTVTNNKTATDAAIASEASTRASAISSEATQRNTLATQLRGSYTGTDVSQLSSGLLFEERQARTTADSALSTSISQVSARLNSGGDIYNSLVTVQNTASAKSANFAQATAPTATKVGDLWIDTANGNLLKRWNGSSWVAADDTRIGATATSVTQLSARLNDTGNGVAMEQRFTAQASSITGLEGKYTVKIDTNGYVSGFGLASAANNATPTSTFAVRSDAFFIASPSGPGIQPSMPFIVRTTATTIGGQNVPAGVYIQDAYIANGTINSAKIANLAVDDAKIANINATKITAGTIAADRLDASIITAKVLTVDWAKITNASISRAQIQDAAINTAKIADTIESTNFSSTTGWQINKAGSATFNQVALRGSINGGSYTGYAWPSAGQTGFHLGPSGLLIGNYNNGSWFQVDASGTLSMPRLSVSSGTLSINGGKFIAYSDGTVVADLVDIRRRQVLESGSCDASNVIAGSYTYTYDNGKQSYTGTAYHPPGTIFSGTITETVATNIYDYDFFSTIQNQPYYVAAAFTGSTFRNWSGTSGSTFELMVTAQASVSRTYSNSGAFANDSRLYIKFDYKIKLVSGQFNGFQVPIISWTLYKL